MKGKDAQKPVAPVIAVLNMKGGVGKTTISANVMRMLYLRFGKAGLLVDFDPQFNLTQAVVESAQYEKLKAAKRTILSVMESEPHTSLFTVKAGTEPPPASEDVTVILRRRTGYDLRLVPGDFDLVKYSMIEEAAVLAPVRQRFKQFVSQAQAEFGFISIDCNPSSSFMTRCALEAATHVLVPVRPDRFSVLGLELLYKFVQESLPTVSKSLKFIVLLNGIPRTKYDPTVENVLRSHPVFGSKTLPTPLYFSGDLSASPNQIGFFNDRKKHSHSAKVRSNVDAVVLELGKELGWPV